MKLIDIKWLDSHIGKYRRKWLFIRRNPRFLYIALYRFRIVIRLKKESRN
jgi:hypothetical protein